MLIKKVNSCAIKVVKETSTRKKLKNNICNVKIFYISFRVS